MLCWLNSDAANNVYISCCAVVEDNLHSDNSNGRFYTVKWIRLIVIVISIIATKVLSSVAEFGKTVYA